MITVKMTKATRNALKKLTMTPIDGWDNMTDDGHYLIELDPMIVAGLMNIGARMDDPQSIEDVILARIKRQEGMLS